MTEKRYIFIGDVHGCLEELRELIDKVQPTPEDEIIFVGDLLDKGPASAAVVKYARELGATLVLGNHEEKHERWRRHTANERSTGKPNPMKDANGEKAAITAGLTAEDVAYLDTAVLFYRVPEYNITVVHGGIPPAVKEMPAEARYRALKGRDREHFGQMLRTRYVNPRGHMVPLGAEQPEDRYWTGPYDGRFGTVLYGHQPYTDTVEPRREGHTIGLDLGCVFGNVLAALVVSPAGQTAVTVPARAKYATHHGEE